MQVRLVAIDLDGTVLRGNGVISRATRKALAMARRHGAVVCVATGRAPLGARNYARILRAHGPLICLDGALAFMGTRTLLDRPIAHDQAAAAAQVAAGLGGGWIALTLEGRVHGGPSRRPPQASLGQVLRHPGRSLRFLRSVWREAHYFSDVVPRVPIYKLLLWAPGGPARASLERDVRKLDVHVPSGPGSTMEVVAPGVSKGHALELVARELGVGRADVVAFGDARNDVEMLAYAGYGVAMGGAPPELLAVADAQTAGVQQDGLARALRRLLHASGSVPPSGRRRYRIR